MRSFSRGRGIGGGVWGDEGREGGDSRSDFAQTQFKSRDELMSDITHSFILYTGTVAQRSFEGRDEGTCPGPAGNTAERNHEKLPLPLSKGSESDHSDDEEDDSDDEDDVEMAVSVTERTS